VRALRESLERVVAERRLDQMLLTKYDIPRPAALGGGFEERWWSPRNAPVFGPDGALISIIHHLEDVTARVCVEAALRQSEEARSADCPGPSTMAAMGRHPAVRRVGGY
jgi:hypothetical protein